MARYAITIFLSAFLLFQVQPLVGKFILPWFGGGPAVWTACMLFFQVLLLAGYAYAHFVTSRIPPRAQVAVHILLLAGSLIFLPIAPQANWKPAPGGAPVTQILLLLLVTIGLPYFLLSSTGPLLQESYRRETGNAPYRLYSLSNVGSLLALLTYPFMFEPQLALQTQTIAWSWAYALFVPLCAWCALGLVRGRAGVELGELAAAGGEVAVGESTRPSWRDILLWLALAACGSVILLATTNQLCQEVTTVPFLWVVPLALYLSTFIICFDHERWYVRVVFLVLLVPAVLGAAYALIQGTGLELWKQVAIYSGTLWVCCMICHGELVKSKPAPQYATLFYLMVAAGGALGGVLVAIVAPAVLPDFWEYQIALVATVVLAFLATYRGAARSGGQPLPAWVLGGGLSLAVGLALGWLVTIQQSDSMDYETNLETTRNFYGVLHVNSSEGMGDANGPWNELVHGRIRHGFQYLEPDVRTMPTTYYGPPSGIGKAIQHHPRRSSGDKTLRIGVVGLGCGTIAAYGQKGDTIRFYEINPEVARIAQEYFSYLRDSKATIEIALGDARIEMERELAGGESQKFDVLAIDAFSSDSIPMHLLTKECGELYLKHLKPDGLLCLHLSNRYLELNGVARGLAEALKLDCVRVDSLSDTELGLDIATWVILTKNREFLDSPEMRKAITPWDEQDPAPLLWTDDYGSLWQTIKN